MLCEYRRRKLVLAGRGVRKEGRGADYGVDGGWAGHRKMGVEHIERLPSNQRGAIWGRRESRHLQSTVGWG